MKIRLANAALRAVSVGVTTLLVMTSANGWAQGKGKKKTIIRESSQEYEYPYGMHGCGLGSMVVDKNEAMPQVGAAWIDWIASGLTPYSPTFAMTSGTSNCEETSANTAAEREVFLRVNRVALERDAAAGGGDSLFAFAEILGCEDAHSKALVYEVSQKRFKDIFSASSNDELLAKYLEALKQQSELSQSCLRLG